MRNKGMFKEKIASFMKNRQIEIVDNRKMKITYDLMIWSMATPHWSWDKILDSVGAGKKMILPEQKPWMDKSL